MAFKSAKQRQAVMIRLRKKGILGVGVKAFIKRPGKQTTAFVVVEKKTNKILSVERKDPKIILKRKLAVVKFTGKGLK